MKFWCIVCKKFYSRFEIFRYIIDVHKKKNKGPSIDPCGTPTLTSAQKDAWPLKTTH